MQKQANRSSKKCSWRWFGFEEKACTCGNFLLSRSPRVNFCFPQKSMAKLPVTSLFSNFHCLSVLKDIPAYLCESAALLWSPVTPAVLWERKMNSFLAHTLSAELLSSFLLQSHSCNTLLLFLFSPPNSFLSLMWLLELHGNNQRYDFTKLRLCTNNWGLFCPSEFQNSF